MLTLTRKEGQTIRVGQDVLIVIKRVKGSYVSVGIDAPLDLTIRRGELTERGDDEGDGEERRVAG